jgi:8-oxo-dGTP pyrophosphatase MutT (NUDIX family)
VSDVSKGAAGPAAASGSVVRAAGGVIWRQHGDERQVLLVHRPRYGDWTLPKGKADMGEDDAVCALREVEEETGYIADLGPELARTRYVDQRGRPKEVRYWAMQVVGEVPGGFEPNDEVDDRQWARLDAARRLLTYARDLVVLDGLEAALARPTG